MNGIRKIQISLDGCEPAAQIFIQLMTEQTWSWGGFDESAKMIKSLEVLWTFCDTGSAESLEKKRTESN